MIPLTCLTPPHVCGSPKSGRGFPSSYVMGFFCAQYIRIRGDSSFC